MLYATSGVVAYGCLAGRGTNENELAFQRIFNAGFLHRAPQRRDDHSRGHHDDELAGLAGDQEADAYWRSGVGVKPVCPGIEGSLA
eukprot:11860952-Prorocentrum_lima.AAC.1